MRIQTTTVFKQQLEPDAHRIAQMQTTQDRETMLGFTAVAEAFIQTGKIIV